MKNGGLLSMAVLAVLIFNSCAKKTPVEQPQSEPAKTQAPSKEITSPAQPEEKPQAQMVPLPLVLPKSMFVGTPENLAGVENLEPDVKAPRPQFLAPAGVENLAMNKPVTGSEMDPITGKLSMIVDGDKEANESSVVELGPFKQWIQIDLESQYELYAVVFWHFHKTPRVYFDVVVQVSNDAEFLIDVKTLFNNDMDNSLGLGVGTDKQYIDKAEGKLVDAKGNKARYVRLYSQGNNQNDYSHYIEVEVFGK